MSINYYTLEEEEEKEKANRFIQDEKGNTFKKPGFTVFKMRNTFISLDKAFEYIGDNSTFQKRTIYILAIQWIFYSFLTMGMPFLFTTPKFMCSKEVDGKIVQVPCSQEDACQHLKDEITYDEKGNPLSRDFNLYCQERVLLGLLGSLFFIGSTFAGLIFPYFADAYGRKRTMISAVIVGGFSVFLCGFVYSIYFFMVFIFIAGFCLNGFEAIVLVYVTEISGARFRNISGVVLAAVWAGAQIFFSPISYFVNNWRYLVSLVIGLPLMLSTILVMFFTVESPRYLITKKKFTEAREILNKIAICNNRPSFEFRLYEEMEEFSNKTNSLEKKVSKINQNTNQEKFKFFHGYSDLFKSTKYRGIALMLCFMWFFQYYTYYGIQFSLSDLGVEAHLNLLFIAMGEMIAALMGAPIKLKVRRRKALIIILIVMTSCCFLLFFFSVPKECEISHEFCKERILILFLTTTMRFCISLVAIILVTYTSEIFPTSLRSKAYGLCMTFGKTGCIIVPIYVSYLKLANVNPLVYIGFLALLALLFSNKLPETFGTQMHDYFLDDNSGTGQYKEIELVEKDKDKSQIDDDDIF